MTRAGTRTCRRRVRRYLSVRAAREPPLRRTTISGNKIKARLIRFYVIITFFIFSRPSTNACDFALSWKKRGRTLSNSPSLGKFDTPTNSKPGAAPFLPVEIRYATPSFRHRFRLLKEESTDRGGRDYRKPGVSPRRCLYYSRYPDFTEGG